jgi:uncharacterized protein with beta-barrel porin domain
VDRSAGARAPRVLRASRHILILAALFAGAWLPSGAQADCVVSPTDSSVVNCTGDNAAGISLNNGSGSIRTLNVYDLTSDIAPGPNVEGIFFGSNEPVSLFVDMGPWKIVTDAAAGIVAGTLGSGAVDIAVSGSIETSGAFAPGILGESLSGALSLRSFATILTTGVDSEGLSASSFSGEVAIFSFGNIVTLGASSHGIYATTAGDIAIASFGDISVSGANAAGIFAESTAGMIAVESAGDISTSGDDGAGIFAEAGGIVAIDVSGRIRTTGDGAFGILAAGDTGTAVMSSADIYTTGDGATGIAVIASGDAAVMSSGNITTTGSTSDGISVQSTSGMAVVVSTGAISATGPGSAGIFVDGDTGALVMNHGSVVGGPCCAGVMMDSAAFNQLLNWGTITAGFADFAMDMIAPTNSVDNFGTVTGDVRLGADMFTSAGTFINHTGALFNSGGGILASLVTNDGTIAPGGRGAIQRTELSDSFEQSSSGIYAVDLDPAASDPLDRNDYLEASNTAEVAGTVKVSLLSLPLAAIESYTILTGMGGLTHDNVGLIASPALHATLTYPNANDVVLGIAVDFDVDGIGLNPNQKAIGENLDKIFRAGVGGVGPVLLGLLNVDSLAEFKDALNQLSPEMFSDAQIAALYSSLAFSNSLLSCKVNGTDTASIIREGQCLWAGASARFMNSSTTSDQIGFDETAGLFTAGAQVALDDVWRLGVAGGYQSSTMQTATGAQSQGSLAQGGVSLKYNPGPLLLAGALTGGGASYDTTRPMAFGGFSGVAEGSQDLGIFSAAFRAAYVLGSPGLYFKPILDASLTHLELGGFTESGGNGAALSIDGGGHTVFSLAPTLEAGTEWWLSNGTLVRPLIRAGAVWYDGADFALTGSFAGAPVGVSPFTINTNIDEVMGLVGAGVEVINGRDAALRLSYDGQLGSDTQIHSVGIKGSSKF